MTSASGPDPLVFKDGKMVMPRTEFVAKIFPVRLRFDLKDFPDEILTEDKIRRMLEYRLGVTVKIGEPEYEAA